MILVGAGGVPSRTTLPVIVDAVVESTFFASGAGAMDGVEDVLLPEPHAEKAPSAASAANTLKQRDITI